MATAPQAAMDMPPEAANPYANPDTAAIYDQMRQSVSPKEFSDEVLAGASQVDPEEVAKFKAELEQLEVPMEVLDMLNNMVDEILANPDNYEQVKQKYEAMGVTDDLLPPQFDGEFFSALNMAVDQMIAEPAGAQAFAKGGIAELSPISKAVADYGRNGDTMLAHITPAEARMLRRRGGAGTTNPDTGLKEYFSLKKLFKGIGNAVKSFASSTVGKIVTTVALGFFLGPAAATFLNVGSAAGVAAVSGFVGSAGSTLLAGGNLKDALKAGAVGGLTAGAIGGVTQGFDTAYAGPTTVGGQVDKFTGMLKSPPFPKYAAQGALTDTATSNAAREAYAGELYKTNPEAFYNPIQAPSISATGEVAGMAPTQPYPAIRPDEFGIDAQTYANTPAIDNRQFIETPANANEQVFTPKKSSLIPDGQGGLKFPEGQTVGQTKLPGGQILTQNVPITDATEFPGSLAKPQGVAPPSAYKVPTIGESFSKMGEGIGMGDGPASYKTFMEGAGDLFAPGPSSEQVTSRAGEILKADATGKMTYADALRAANAEGPGILRTYGPAAVAGIATLGAAGGFKPTSAAPSTLRPELMKPVTQRIAEGGNQRNYYVQGLPGVKYDQYGAPIFGQNVPLPTFETGLGVTALMNPKGYADGGSIAVGYAGGGRVDDPATIPMGNNRLSPVDQARAIAYDTAVVQSPFTNKDGGKMLGQATSNLAADSDAGRYGVAGTGDLGQFAGSFDSANIPMGSNRLSPIDQYKLIKQDAGLLSGDVTLRNYSGPLPFGTTEALNRDAVSPQVLKDLQNAAAANLGGDSDVGRFAVPGYGDQGQFFGGGGGGGIGDLIGGKPSFDEQGNALTAFAGGGLTGVSDVAKRVVDANNFDSTAYLNANPDVKAAIAKGEIADAYSHYTKFGQAEGRTAFDKAETAATAAKDAAEKAAAQAANRKAVADAKAAKKAAGFTSAYQNINAGLSYDAPAGIAATAIAARQAAFKPTMDKFTQAQATNAATLAKPYTPTVVDQPYNNTTGYTNVLNPVAPPINYDTTPVGTTQPPVTVTQPPLKDISDTFVDVGRIVDDSYKGRPINDQEVKDWLIAHPEANDQEIARTMDQYNVRPDQVARVTGMQDVSGSSMQNIDRRYNMAKAANEANPFALAYQKQANAVTGQSIQDYFAKNPGMTDTQIASYMDQNAIDPRQMQAAFAGTPGAISSQDVLARYQAATKLPAMVAGSPQEQAAVADGQALLQKTLAAKQSPTKLLNMGGIASLGSGGYPRRTGQISGPGTATSDSIPAMLSDGEFVMTAKAVRGAGKGDKRAGAKRMYALMNQLEKNAARG